MEGSVLGCCWLSAVDSGDLGWFRVVEWLGNGGGRRLGRWVSLGKLSGEVLRPGRVLDFWKKKTESAVDFR